MTTTAVRIREYLSHALDIPAGVDGSPLSGLDVASSVLAAEMDALRDERDQLKAENDALRGARPPWTIDAADAVALQEASATIARIRRRNENWVILNFGKPRADWKPV